MKKAGLRCLIVVIVLLVCMIVGYSVREIYEKQKSPLIETIKGYKGYIRTVGQEEYDFYAYFVERDLSGEIYPEELDEKIRTYINEVNAVFYLGNQLGLCEPYSFELLKLRMEQENNVRKVKLEQGEPIYGLKEFRLETYFQYVFTSLETDIIAYIEENADREIIRQAEEYYDANPDLFNIRKSVAYEITMQGKTEAETADREQLNFLGKSDMGLADFLEVGQPGDIYEDVLNGEKRKILLKNIEYTEKEGDMDKKTIIYRYILSELYPLLISSVARNNPVEFE